MPLSVAAAMLATLLLNYLGWALGVAALLSTPTLVLYLVLLVACLAAPGTWSAHQPWAKLVVLALLTIALGTATDAWDARSIWMYHGKRIYLEANLYAQLDGYFALSHNEYPVLVPALAASIARLLGGWNEIAPKLAATLLWVPALLVILELLPTLAARLLFLVATLMINAMGLVDGMLDMPLALTVAACAAAMQRLLLATDAGRAPSRVLGVLPPLLLAAMAITKNEGLVLALLLTLVFALLAARQRRLRALRLTLVLSALAPAFAIAWMLACQARGLASDLGPGALARLAERLVTLDSHTLIVAELLGSTPLLACALLAVAGAASGAPRVALPLIAAVAYLAVLYGVYLATPNDLQWHLASSASRALHSVQLLLLYAGLATMPGGQPPGSAQTQRGVGVG